MARVLYKITKVLRDQGALELSERNDLYELIDQAVGTEVGYVTEPEGDEDGDADGE